MIDHCRKIRYSYLHIYHKDLPSFGAVEFDFRYIGHFFVQISGWYFEQRFAVRLLDRRSLDCELTNIFQQFAFMLILKLQLCQLLGLQILKELYIVTLQVKNGRHKYKFKSFRNCFQNYNYNYKRKLDKIATKN